MLYPVRFIIFFPKCITRKAQEIKENELIELCMYIMFVQLRCRMMSDVRAVNLK
jgi:hypothetical protein